MSTAQQNSYLNGYYAAINYGCGLPISFYEHQQYFRAIIQYPDRMINPSTCLSNSLQSHKSEYFPSVYSKVP